MPGKCVIIVLSDPSRVDVDWILPLIDELTAENRPVTVFDFTPVDRDDRTAFSMRALRLVLGRWPGRYGDLEPIPGGLARSLDRLRASAAVTLARVGALYYSAKSPLAVWRRRARTRKLDRLFRDAAALFVGLRDTDWADGTGEADLIAAARRSGVPVFGYPPVVDHEIPHRRLMDCDVALANTGEQGDGWRRVSGVRVQAVTPPLFTERWHSRIVAIQHALFGEQEVPRGGKTALVVLKNDNSIVWTGLDFHETASEMLGALLDAGMHLLIKPHPRQGADALRRLLASLDPARYTLVDGPLAYWSQRVDLVVSLFSGGVLDCLAAGRVAVLYWPMTPDYLAKIRSGEVTDVYVRQRCDGTPTTKYRDFCFEVTEPGFALPVMADAESRLRAFRTHYPPVPDCRAIRALIGSWRKA